MSQTVVCHNPARCGLKPGGRHRTGTQAADNCIPAAQRSDRRTVGVAPASALAPAKSVLLTQLLASDPAWETREIDGVVFALVPGDDGEPIVSATDIGGRLAYAVPEGVVDPGVLASPETKEVTVARIAREIAVEYTGEDSDYADQWDIAEEMYAASPVAPPEWSSSPYYEVLWEMRVDKRLPTWFDEAPILGRGRLGYPKRAVKVLAPSPFSPDPVPSYAVSSRNPDPNADRRLREVVLGLVAKASSETSGQ